MTPVFFIAIAVGGFFGSITRAWIGRKMTVRTFPAATFTVNILGSFLFGAFVHAQDKLPPWLSLALLTGFCGAFTTFSTLILETVILFRAKQTKPAFAYLFLTIIISILSSACGLWLGSYLIKHV